MYKEFEFTEEQKGYGLAFTDPMTGIRCLVGIFDTYEEARLVGQDGCVQAMMIRPEILEWNRENYEKYDWVYKK